MGLREQRINAEINDLQQRIVNNGYHIGEPIDMETAPEDVKDWILRIWLLGYALTRPWVMWDL